MQITHCCWHTHNHSDVWPYPPDPGKVGQMSALMKRRLTPLGRWAVTLLYQLSSYTTTEITWVVASRRTDIARKMRLLVNLAQHELLSPTDFSMSVHNAIIGAFSIATHNTQMHTAVAASDNSFIMGLLEAFALQTASQHPVGYLYYDAIVPQQLEEIDGMDYPVTCLAMLFSNEQDKGITIRYVSEPPIAGAVREPPLRGKENTELLLLIDYLTHGTKSYTIALPGGRFLLEHSHS